MRLQIPREVVRFCLAKPGNLSRSGNAMATHSIVPHLLPIHVDRIGKADVQVGEIARDLYFRVVCVCMVIYLCS